MMIIRNFIALTEVLYGRRPKLGAHDMGHYLFIFLYSRVLRYALVAQGTSFA
jgi:hypothetical protein